jgi:hypothetical protein
MNSQISHIHNQIVRNPETDRERHLDYKENWNFTIWIRLDNIYLISLRYAV